MPVEISNITPRAAALTSAVAFEGYLEARSRARFGDKETRGYRLARAFRTLMQDGANLCATCALLVADNHPRREKISCGYDNRQPRDFANYILTYRYLREMSCEGYKDITESIQPVKDERGRIFYAPRVEPAPEIPRYAKPYDMVLPRTVYDHLRTIKPNDENLLDIAGDLLDYLHMHLRNEGKISGRATKSMYTPSRNDELFIDIPDYRLRGNTVVAVTQYAVNFYEGGRLAGENHQLLVYWKELEQKNSASGVMKPYEYIGYSAEEERGITTKIVEVQLKYPFLSEGMIVYEPVVALNIENLLSGDTLVKWTYDDSRGKKQRLQYGANQEESSLLGQLKDKLAVRLPRR